MIAPAQAAPNSQPASTSLIQCTPRYTREKPTTAMTPTAPVHIATLPARAVITQRLSIHAHNKATAAVPVA